jgi:DNA repair ATPase RecN
MYQKNAVNLASQCGQIVQQLINQTNQSTQMYQQMLQKEQQNITELEHIAQKERQAIQTIQNVLHGHQTAIQDLNNVQNMCRQLEQTIQSATMNQSFANQPSNQTSGQWGNNNQYNPSSSQMAQPVNSNPQFRSFQ